MKEGRTQGRKEVREVKFSKESESKLSEGSEGKKDLRKKESAGS